MTTLAIKLQALRQRIAAAETRFGRAPGSVDVIAASKNQTVATLRAAMAAGLHRFGESYAREALDKILALADQPPEWHYIGPVQRNKTRVIAEQFAWIHSLDRVDIAARCNAQRPASLAPLQVCIQVNISGEHSKSGIAPQQLADFAAALRDMPQLCLRGLMTVPAQSADFAEQHAAFARLKSLYDTLRADGYPLDTLSMGMSDDLEAAIAAGATLVRIGTALFGKRQP